MCFCLQLGLASLFPGTPPQARRQLFVSCRHVGAKQLTWGMCRRTAAILTTSDFNIDPNGSIARRIAAMKECVMDILPYDMTVDCATGVSPAVSCVIVQIILHSSSVPIEARHTIIATILDICTVDALFKPSFFVTIPSIEA